MRRPACPRHQHSKVWFDGTYGAPGRERQRYKCVPLNGEKRHVFTEPLPRQRTARGDCAECERAFGPDEGPPAVRGFTYTANEVANALLEVGRGATYSSAARASRVRAGRAAPPLHPAARPRASRDSAIVEDWVEVFAPTLLERRLPRAWPEVVVLDDLPFRVRSSDSKSGSVVAWRVLGARGGDGSILRFEAFSDKRSDNWRSFLTALDGTPSLIVADNESGMMKGIELAFGTRPYSSPVVWLCHYHLQIALEKLLRRYNADPLLLAAAARGFKLWRDWRLFIRLSRRYRVPELDRWLNQPDPTWWAGNGTRYDRVVWQLANRESEYPTTAGAIEASFEWLRRHLDQRKFALRNRPRTNLLLGLMQAHLNNLDDVHAYSREIREAALAHDGRSAPRGLITDRRGYSSLWV